MDVVLTTAGGSAPRVRVNAAHALVVSRLVLLGGVLVLV